MNRLLRLLLVALLLGALPLPADEQEDEDWGDDPRKDHDRARRALREADLRPLAEILASVEESGRARVIEVELERERGRFLYELKVLTRNGRLLELAIDAASGALLELEEEEEEDDDEWDEWSGGREDDHEKDRKRERDRDKDKPSADPRGQKHREDGSGLSGRRPHDPPPRGESSTAAETSGPRNGENEAREAEAAGPPPDDPEPPASDPPPGGREEDGG